LTAAALAVGIALVIAVATQYASTYSLARQAARLEQYKRELAEQNTRLREEIHLLRTDDRYIERLARQQLGLVRPGEVELLIVPPRAGAPRARPGDAQKVPGGAALPPDGTLVVAQPGQDAGTGSPDSHAAASSAGRFQQWTERLYRMMQRLFGWPDR
jgi:cell division protein FtsB